jgi:hypothetical protein
MEIYDFLILLIKFYKITKSKQIIFVNKIKKQGWKRKWNNLKLFEKC